MFSFCTHVPRVRAGLRPRAKAALCALACAFAAAPAKAQVLEPNGVSVPAVSDGETSLQAYFDAQGEPIDAVAEASAEPGVFSPLCDFQAALVLSESQGQAGISWYNVPSDPNAAPAEVYEIVPPGLAVGEVVSSADVRNHPAYEGGLIGFVLMKGETRAYYSEYQRNVFCSNCTDPDYWKMMLVYNSRNDANTFYLAFEDWEGANESEWFGNDGDFNDKVFRVSGVSCVGGGEPCDTGQPGVCAAGLTECAVGATLECKQQIQPTDEVCDNVDNDCDGLVDDGEGLCPAGQVCDRGRCVGSCDNGEFPCPSGFSCEDGFCIEEACVGVTCDEGRVCRGGDCVAACDGIVCPLGLQCHLGRCVDLCDGVSCGPGTVCQSGACISECGCRGCPAGLACAPDGRCVDPGCDVLTCDQGFVCVSGVCEEACAGAVCPGGVSCELGRCAEPLVEDDPTQSSVPNSVSLDGGIVLDPDPVAGPSTSNPSGGEDPNGAAAAGMAFAERGETDKSGDPGCACRITAFGATRRDWRSTFGLASLALFCSALLLWRRKVLWRRKASI